MKIIWCDVCYFEAYVDDQDAEEMKIEGAMPGCPNCHNEMRWEDDWMKKGSHRIPLKPGK